MKVGNYEFSLKNFKYLESRSEETYCFGAVLYVNNKKLANCGNSGQGGPTDIHFFPQYRQLGSEIEDFLKTQPKVKDEGCDFEMELNLEYIVDELVVECLKALDLKKLKKQMNKCLVFQNVKGDYFHIKWKYTIDELLKIQPGRDMLKKTIAEQVAKGNILINENIPSELLPR